ncbi:MAG: hypothetical protein ACP5F6_00725 [Microbacter sp.]
MALYYVDKERNAFSNHEVHQSGCAHLPSIHQLVFLGDFDNHEDAVKEAEKYFLHVSLCPFCCA